MRLLLDMNLSPRWVRYLNDVGFEAQHWSNVGLANANDLEIMDYAKNRDLVVITHDLDFGAILAATNGLSPSVVQIRADDLSIEAIGEQIVGALRQTSEALTDGALVTVNPVRTRLTLLPIRMASEDAEE